MGWVFSCFGGGFGGLVLFWGGLGCFGVVLFPYSVWVWCASLVGGNRFLCGVSFHPVWLCTVVDVSRGLGTVPSSLVDVLVVGFIHSAARNNER